MPEVNIKPDSAPNVEWQDTMYRFDGQWMPDVDGALIGPNNYQTLENLRYKDSGLEGVNGYTKVNTSPLTTYTKIRTGHQLRTNKTQDSYVLVQAVDGSEQGRVYVNRTAPGSQGPFDTTSRLDVNGNSYFEDNNASLVGRFSDAPQGNIAYCNGEESMIFGGDEQRVGACFSATETFGSEIITSANDRTVTMAHNWANVDVNSYNHTGGDISVTADAADQYFTLGQANAVTVIGTAYHLEVDVANLVGTWTLQSGDGTQNLGVITANGTGVTAEWRATTTGGIRVVANESNSSADFDNWSIKPSYHGSQIDVTQRINNTLNSSSDDMFTVNGAAANLIILCATRPIQAAKFYVDSGNANATPSQLTALTWDGTGYQTIPISSDGTSSGGVAFAQTGVVSLTSHSEGTAELHHEEGLYLYTYIFELSAGDADIYHITVDPAFQTVKDVWDGVYRQPIQFQVLDDSVGTFDYTLQVNESSDVNAPIGADLVGNGTDANDKVYIMFEDQMSAIKFTMLANLINTASSTMTMKYWNGTAYSSLTVSDGTAVSGVTCAQSGLISWTPPSDEVARNLYGSFGYVYEIDFSAALANAGAGSQVLVDICTGVPAQLTVRPFDYSAIYGTRLMLGGFSKGDEGNRMDYSVANAPDAFNGFDSSDNGKQSLYFGGVEPIVAATQVYNRFGASVYAMLLVLKKNETYILVGDTPEDFVIYDVAKTVGCVAPLSLATAEIGLDLGNGLTRNVAIWLSHSGPVMFDGAILTPIPGIRSYFDPNNAEYIDFDLVSKAQGWVDPNYKEYNLLIPSGSASLNNVWLVYDLMRRKWFKKTTSQAAFPQTGFEVGSPSTGRRYVYGGIDTGYMIQLETGTYWDDGSASGITQKVKTGDFFPSGNPWDSTTIRKFKIFIKRLTGSSVTNTLEVIYYTNTDLNAGSGVIFEDGNAASGIYVTWTDTDGVAWASATSATVDLDLDVGLQRLIRVIQDLNRTGWAHAFEFSVTTSDITKGFQPILWGVQYRIERKDNTAT